MNTDAYGTGPSAPRRVRETRPKTARIACATG